jgi:hypothetical protein
MAGGYLFCGLFNETVGYEGLNSIEWLEENE